MNLWTVLILSRPNGQIFTLKLLLLFAQTVSWLSQKCSLTCFNHWFESIVIDFTRVFHAVYARKMLNPWKQKTTLNVIIKKNYGCKEEWKISSWASVQQYCNSTAVGMSCARLILAHRGRRTRNRTHLNLTLILKNFHSAGWNNRFYLWFESISVSCLCGAAQVWTGVDVEPQDARYCNVGEYTVVLTHVHSAKR